MWFRSGTDVVRFGADGSIATLHVRKPSAFLVQEARDGSVWVAFPRRVLGWCATPRGYSPIYRFRPIRRRRLDGQVPRVCLLAMAKDTHGELLLLTPAGLVRIVEGKAQSSRSQYRYRRMTANVPKVRSLLVDREGNRVGWNDWKGAGSSPPSPVNGLWKRRRPVRLQLRYCVSGSRRPHLAGRRFALLVRWASVSSVAGRGRHYGHCPDTRRRPVVRRIWRAVSMASRAC